MAHRLVDLLKSEIKALVTQEVRLLRAKEASPPVFILDEMTQSIHETKKRIALLVERMDSQKRNRLIKRIVDQTLEEEIDQAIEARKDRCLRCLHIRFFDETGEAHVDLPCGTGRGAASDRDVACDASTLTIGCEHPCLPGASCEGFREKKSAPALEDYISEVVFFYEIKEMFDGMKEIWEDYLDR